MKRQTWKILARHKWISDCIITESVNKFKDDGETSYRRFTATILGWRNFKIYEGYLTYDTANAVKRRVENILEKIKSGDDSVFKEPSEIIGVR